MKRLLLAIALLGATARADDLRTWWESFHDPVLASLVSRALDSNLDLKTAASRVDEARAARGVAKSALGPSLGASAGYTRVRGGIAQGLRTPYDTEIFQGAADSSWEVDLFGGLRKGVNAATADLAAAEAARAGVRIAVAAEIAGNYMSLRGTQQRLVIVQENIALQRDSLALTESRRNAGLAPALDVIRAEAQLRQTEAEAPPLEAETDRAIHALAILSGKRPTALVQELAPAAPLPGLPALQEIPADLLRRRPDLLRAEAEVNAEAARTGAARAERYPKLVITGLIGRQATDAPALTLGASNFFSVGPAIRLPIFTSGRIRSNIKVHEARWDQAMTSYESAVLKALAEVEDALSLLHREKTRHEDLRAAEGRSREAVSLTRELYSKGLGDYLAVLDAQREFLAIQQQRLQSETSAALDAVTLYKSLGGGW